MRNNNIALLNALGRGAGANLASFVAYLRGAGIGIKDDPDKTFGDLQRWQAINVKGNTSTQFFKGDPTAAQTNMTGGFESARGEHFLVTGISFMEDDDVTTDWGAADLSWGISEPALLSGKLSINNGGVTSMEDFSMGTFRNVTEQYQPGYYEFAEPKLWAGNTEFVVTVDTPTAITATNTYVWLVCQLHGVGLFS